jgi:hypothetical protein
MSLFGNTSSSTSQSQTNRQVTTGPDSNGITLGSINTQGGNASNTLKSTQTSAGTNTVGKATNKQAPKASAPAASGGQGASSGGSGNVTINATSTTADTQAVEANASLAASAISAVTSLGAAAINLAGQGQANVGALASQGIQAGQNYAALSTGTPGVAEEIASPTYTPEATSSNKTLILLSVAGLVIGVLYLFRQS